jgi:hypothetical protein
MVREAKCVGWECRAHIRSIWASGFRNDALEGLGVEGDACDGLFWVYGWPRHGKDNGTVNPIASDHIKGGL